MEHAHQKFVAPTPEVSEDATSTGYTCPMHQEVRSPQPGNCPKCGMVLVPVV